MMVPCLRAFHQETSSRLWITIFSAVLIVSGAANAADTAPPVKAKPLPVEKVEPAPVKDDGPKVYLNPNSLDAIRQTLGFEKLRAHMNRKLWAPGSNRPNLKVAILDRGFKDWEERRGKTLPKRTRYIAGPLATPNVVPHGTLMGEILTSMVAGPEWETPNMAKLPFDLYLINASGFSNFKAAVQTVIDEQVDIVLYSEVWELGGNWDGQGFINAEVSKAIEAGVLWVNAAGNFSGRAFDSQIVVLDNDVVELPGENNSVQLICEPFQGETECPIKATLAWNDFKDDSSKGTEKDLDLGLFNSKFKPVQLSKQKQVDIEGEVKDGEMTTKYPRESIVANLKKGTYYLRVRSKQRDWTSKDRLRILVDGDAIRMPLGSYRESLQNPADHPGVVTVGASDSERSSVSVELAKPELVVRSSATERFGKEFRGSSNAAAIVAAGAILMKYLDPEMGRREFLARVSAGDFMIGQATYGWQDLGMQSPPMCFPLAQIRTGIKAIDQILQAGGTWIQTPMGPKILINSPVSVLHADVTDQIQQSLWVGERGLQVMPRGQVGTPELANSVEVMQRPQGTAICGETSATKFFSLIHRICSSSSASESCSVQASSKNPFPF